MSLALEGSGKEGVGRAPVGVPSLQIAINLFAFPTDVAGVLTFLVYSGQLV